MIDSIDGRKRGYLIKPDGQKVFESQLSSLVKVLPNSVERVQYIQNSERDITFLDIPDRTRFSSEHEQQLYRFLKTLLGADMQVSLRAVQEIPLEVSGKRYSSNK